MRTTNAARFRAKAIQSLSYAAICGISISFSFGEYANAGSGILSALKNTKYVSVPDISAIKKPYIALAKALNKKEWQEELLAVNSRVQSPVVIEPATVKAEAIAVPAFRALLQQTAQREITQNIKIIPSERQLKNIHKILLSVHQTEEKLSVSKDKVTARAAAPEAVMPAKIHGRLLPVGSGVMNGHFEVGLYTSVNSLGLPVGYPVAQQILPTGVTDFSLQSTNNRVYLFARYSSDDSENKEHWYPSENNPIDLDKKIDQIADIKFHPLQPALSAVEPAEVKAAIRGHINAMFVHASANIPLAGATIKLRGTSLTTVSNISGDFVLPIEQIDGPLLLEVVKPGYFPTIVKVDALEAKANVYIELASKDAIDQMANALGLRQSVGKSVFIGKAQSINGRVIPDFSVQLSLHAEGPFYFTKEGFPTTSGEQRSTSSDGRFIYFNVEPGVGYLEAQEQGEPIAPILFTAVEGGGLIYKILTPIDYKLQGRVTNPVARSKDLEGIAGARIKIAGNAEWSNTDAKGQFQIGAVKAFRGEDLALELSADKYYGHRYIISVGSDAQKTKNNNLNLFAFPATYINAMANSVDTSLDPYSGIIIGGVGHKSLRIDALAEHADTNNAKDYYFDAHGALKGSFAQTDKNFGTYIVFNVPKGRVLLHGLNSSGSLEYSGITYTSPSTVNIIIQ